MTSAKFFLLGALAVPGITFAAPLCSTGTLQDYLAHTGPCEIGDKTFFDFVYVGIGPIAVAPADITITPLPGTNVGLRFSGPFDVSGLNLVSETFFAFRVATISGLPTIVKALQHIDAGFTLTGAVSVDEKIDDGTLLGKSLNGRTSIASTQLDDSADLNPSSQIRVTKDVFLTSGALGSASLRSIDQIFQQNSSPPPPPPVPEPSTILLGLAGCMVLVSVRYRRS